MQRRNFLKNTLITSAGIIAAPVFSHAGWFARRNELPYLIEDLAQYFINPPDSARPWVFYMWMNGNITKEGITLDLEAMKRMGIGGAICFNSAVGIPRGPVDYAGPEWMDSTVHAIQEAERLGLQLAIHNSPGYSGCGGPWVTPELSMQQLVWTETLYDTGKSSSITLPKPYAKHNYYQDAMVVAYPALSVEQGLMKDKLKRALLNGQEIDKQIITDGNPETKIRLETENGKVVLLLEFEQAFEARAIGILRKPEIPEDLFDGPRDHPPVFLFEYAVDGIHFKTIGKVSCPALREMDTPATLSFEAVSAKYFRLTANSATWLSEVELFSGPRLGGWSGKTSFTHGDFNGNTPNIASELLIQPEEVIDISKYLDASGKLNWKAPKGRWTILRIGHTTTGEEPAAHPDSGKGLEIDKFRKEALDFHFDTFLDKLINRVKANIGSGLKGITVDSWEAGKQNWTPDFPNEFLNRKKYEILSWMPALTGRIVGSIRETEAFLWDVRKVQADLLADNFYGHYADCSHKRGLEFYAEPYGDGNLDSLKIGEHLDVMMSEFWTRYMYGSDTTSKQAASVAHVYGKKIVAAESYTAMPELSKWTDYPYSLKAEGDYFFSLGVNRLVFHTFVHQPYTTGFPGMTMGPFGMHIDRNNTWTEQAFAWTGYLKRSQYLLQQGLAIADVCYFKGDEPESGVPDIYTFMPYGYAGDVIGADAFKRFSIENAKIVLPDGMQYQVFVMAPLEAILPATLEKIIAMVDAGMTLVVNSKPQKTLGRQTKDEAIVGLIDQLYGKLDGQAVQVRKYGKGQVIWKKSMDAVFEHLGIAPDFAYTAEQQDAAIHYMHKKLKDAEFYFVSNHRRRTEKLVLSFRTSGQQPEIWNAEEGTYNKVAVYQDLNGRTVLPITLHQASSVFIVFRHKQITPIDQIVKNGNTVLSNKSFPKAKASLYPDLSGNFTISLWAKPDTVARSGRSMLFHASQGELVYGKGHAVMALSAGQNGVRVYERSIQQAKEVLFAAAQLSGWTHISVVYQGGKPILFINGLLAATGKISIAIVHPGLGTPANQEQYTSYFEGNYTKPKLEKNAWSEADVLADFHKGLPAEIELPEMEIRTAEDLKRNILFWENGMYQVKTGNVARTIKVNDCAVTKLEGSWNLEFPLGSAAPAKLQFPALTSLKDHPDFNVKHFSGTVLYQKALTLKKDAFQKGRRFFLDLGRVEVIAEVKINGKDVGVLWKEPYRAELTGLLQPGENHLEIRVTTLWQNRLIGDEQLPVENAYSVHGFIEKLPDWYVKNQPKPGQRKAFSVWHNLKKTDPLLESGLLGPVRLITAVDQLID